MVGREDDLGAPVTRAEIEALRERVAAIERASGPLMRCGACHVLMVAQRFCPECGAPFHAARPVEATPPTQFAPALAGPPAPRPPEVLAARPAPLPAEAVPAPRPAPSRAGQARGVDIESLLGQQWAPRIGALLLFLGVVFFLGVAIQRGWIGPVAQLLLATLTGATLLALGALLTRRRGYGIYPQVLEGTGACILYVTAFVSHALPYYRDATGMTALASGGLMALVATGTIALALHRDARVIAAIGYTLGLGVAWSGAGTMPALTLPYLALLATSLAFVVARKGWMQEAVAGTALTGLLFLGRSAAGDDGLLLVASAVPTIAAFLWLAARPASPSAPSSMLLPTITALLTYTWGLVVTLQVAGGAPYRAGLVVLGWALLAAAHAGVAERLRASTYVPLASGAVALVLWLGGAPMMWRDTAHADVLVAATYALVAIALAVAPRARLALGGVLMAGAAALYPVMRGTYIQEPLGDGLRFGGWEAWAILAIVAVSVGAFFLRPSAERTVARAAALAILVLFVATWSFALASSPLAVTLVLLAGAGLTALAARRPQLGDLHLGAAGLAALAGLQAVLFVQELGLASTWIEGGLVLVALLAFALLEAPRGQWIPRLTGLSTGIAVAALALHAFGAWRGLVDGASVATLSLLVGTAVLAWSAIARPSVRAVHGNAALGLALVAAAHVLLWPRFADHPFDEPLLQAVTRSALAAAALLALFHLDRARRILPDEPKLVVGAALVGGSAIVLSTLIVARGEGAWASLLLGALGVAYLAAGLVLRALALHRYAGFAILALVLGRVFAVDMREADLAIRAIVFVVLGAALLGIGYAYARLSRRATPGEEIPPDEVVDGSAR